MTPGVDALGMEDLRGRNTTYTTSYDGFQLRGVMMGGKSKANAAGGTMCSRSTEYVHHHQAAHRRSTA